MKILFQGGFAGKVNQHVFQLINIQDCQFLFRDSEEVKEFKELCPFYPEDKNSLQVFPITEDKPLISLKILFNKSTDFYGRIVVYQLDVLGAAL